MLFAQEVRARLKASGVSMPCGETMKLCGAEWSGLSNDEKEQYKVKATLNRQQEIAESKF